jgi:hypothetical protein
MNKKVKKPEFKYPFKDKDHEESCKRFDMPRMRIVSDRGSKVELTQTEYKGGWHKIELKETIYIQNDSGKKLGELLHLRPYDQVRLRKLLDFAAHINLDGNMFVTRKDYASKPIEFNKNQRAVIELFYERKGVTLEDAVELLQRMHGNGYKDIDSLRQMIRRINEKIIAGFHLTKKDELITGTFDKKRSGYSFNPNIRFEFIDDRSVI